MVRSAHVLGLAAGIAAEVWRDSWEYERKGSLSRNHIGKNQRREGQDISKMPEVRDGKRTALTDLSGGGFFIRRVSSPGAMQARGAGKPLSRRFIMPSSNKENMPPVWAVRATPPKRRSPLPDWYPRTPLRDITAIVKAVERSRLRIAAAQEQGQSPEQSLQPANMTAPVQEEQDIPHRTEAQDSLAVASGSGSTQIVASPAHSFKVHSSPSESSLKTPSKPMDPALADHMEKKLSSSIEQIEKMVRKNLKRTPKAAQPSRRANQKRILMSMR